MFRTAKVVVLGLLCGGLSIGAYAQTIDNSKSLQVNGISGITAYFAKAYTPTGTIAASFPNIDNGSIPTSINASYYNGFLNQRGSLEVKGTVDVNGKVTITFPVPKKESILPLPSTLKTDSNNVFYQTLQLWGELSKPLRGEGSEKEYFIEPVTTNIATNNEVQLTNGMIMFVDKDCIINGTVTYAATQNSALSILVFQNVICKKGWNILQTSDKWIKDEKTNAWSVNKSIISLPSNQNIFWIYSPGM